MRIRTTIIRQRQMSRLFKLTATVAVMLTVLFIALYLMKQTRRRFTRVVEFDPRACVRLFQVNRVYRVRPADHDPGELWFATDEGIRALETETLTWHRYGRDHGLTTETIVDICFGDKTVWAATWDGLMRLDRAGDRFVPVPAGGGRVLAAEYVPNAGLFFAVDARGLFHLPAGDSVPHRITIPDVPGGVRITCLKYRPEGGLLVGIEGRVLLEYSTTESRFRPFAFSRAASRASLIWDVMFRDGRMWVATSDDGLWRAERTGDTLRPVEDFPAKGAYVFADEVDGFFCGTPFGLWRYHESAGGAWIQLVHPDEKQPTDFEVFTLANTPRQLWYGSMDLGAGYLVKDRVEWQPLRAGLSSSNIAAMAADDSLLWTAYGYEGEHLDRFFAGGVQYDRNYNQLDGIIDPRLQCLVLAGNRLYFGGDVCFGWLGANGLGVRYYGPGSKLPHADIADICVAPDSTLYLAGNFGLLHYDSPRDTFDLMAGTEGVRITCVVPDSGMLWLGTLSRGLRLYDVSARATVGTWLTGTTRIQQVGLFGDHGVVVSTKESGLYRIGVHDGSVKVIEMPPGLFDEEPSGPTLDIMCARVIDGRFWLGTRNSGCLVYNPADSTWAAVTFADGLVSDRVRSFAESRDFLWVGALGGVNRFDKTYIYERIADRSKKGRTG